MDRSQRPSEVALDMRNSSGEDPTSGLDDDGVLVAVDAFMLGKDLGF
jgi:hypothetical protein